MRFHPSHWSRSLKRHPHIHEVHQYLPYFITFIFCVCQLSKHPFLWEFSVSDFAAFGCLGLSPCHRTSSKTANLTPCGKNSFRKGVWARIPLQSKDGCPPVHPHGYFPFHVIFLCKEQKRVWKMRWGVTLASCHSVKLYWLFCLQCQTVKVFAFNKQKGCLVLLSFIFS